ncbi:hypothetical protein SAMN05216466_12753 [Paraburkholderia phenazinium]|uniref:Uncharacterized protein n=1 Tax=Paraburkholderia phenazinium TaxID=60549 RepID=A0A1G8I1A9_9BURK|nr:hypothetical protein SAMN05216466_117144 [Paraburkholderia phenazinium]SDI59760.1 hypothetical protein SAMN05216466_12753 [Paraburkholderia phenazinium]
MGPNAWQRRSRCFEVNVQRVVPQKVYGDCLDKAGNCDLVDGSERSKKLISIPNSFSPLIWSRHFHAPKKLTV